MQFRGGHQLTLCPSSKWFSMQRRSDTVQRKVYDFLLSFIYY